MIKKNSQLECLCQWKKGHIELELLNAFWETGIPLLKVDSLGSLLEENG